MWLANLFATKRELTRLAREVDYFRGRAQALERQLEKERIESREREFRLIDRVLVSKQQFAITDEVRHTVERNDADLMAAKEKEVLAKYLEMRRKEVLDDAREAGIPIADAERFFNQNEQSYIEAFQSESDFN